MQEFILRNPIVSYGAQRQLRICFSKGTYQPNIKITGWEVIKSCEPKDHNPYDPPGGNYFLSTYNRLSDLFPNEFSTTTKDMLEQIWTKNEYEYKNPHRPKTYSFFDKRDLDRIQKETVIYPEWPTPDYTTTMQSSYTQPFPQVIYPITMTKTPFELNRFPAWDRDDLKSTKFTDDDMIKDMCHVFKVKQKRYVSYSPTTKAYTNYDDK